MTTRQITEAINHALREGSRSVIATLIDPGAAEAAVGAKLIIQESGERHHSLGQPELDDAVARHARVFLQTRDEAKASKVSDFAPELTQFAGATILFERLEAEPRLVIAGAGHVGASLARLAATVGYRVTLIDDRAEFVNRDSFPTKSEESIELIGAKDWQAAMSKAIGDGRGVSVAIVTRGHKQDEDCLRAALTARPDYLGMIGSKRRTNIVLDKLREEGADQDELRKVRAPIGLDIGAVSPEEVAVAILAEIVAERRGGAGAPLSGWRRA
jgi:xanthine dehydrogenase accessory factor